MIERTSESAPRPTVLICQPFLYRQPGAYSQILSAGGLDIRFPNPGGKVLTEAQLESELAGVHATIASTEPYTDSVFRRFTNLRVVSRTGVGFDSVDVEAATKHNVAVACTPGVNHEAVAEHVFALLLASVKRVLHNHAEVASGGFRRQTSRALRGRVMGLLGLGRIGTAVAHRALAFGMQVLAHDPFLTCAPSSIAGVELVSLDELLARSDVVSLHAAATAGTRKIICHDTLARMKDGATLINTARGTLVDEVALAEALRSGKIGAAALDVFEQEPPAGSPLLSAPNVILSPHIAGVDEQTMVDMAKMAAETIVELFQGGWPAERLVNGTQLARPWSWSC